MKSEVHELPHLLFIPRESIRLGPAVFASGRDEKMCIEIEKGFNRDKFLDQALNCLYFALNATRIYDSLPRDPLSLFVPSLPFTTTCSIDASSLDKHLQNALGKLLTHAYRIDGDAKEREKAFRMLRSLQHALNKDFPWLIPERGNYQFLMLSLAFEALLKLNPRSPAADLRQRLRPLLHLKFSRPVELLWSFVDQFYLAREEEISGVLHTRPLFLSNPNVEISLESLAEKLFIYIFYEELFLEGLLEGKEGTSTTPDNFKSIHPERVLVFFWPEETLSKKQILFTEPSKIIPEAEIAMLQSLRHQHKQLQKRSQKGELPEGEKYTQIT